MSGFVCDQEAKHTLNISHVKSIKTSSVEAYYNYVSQIFLNIDLVTNNHIFSVFCCVLLYKSSLQKSNNNETLKTLSNQNMTHIKI